MEQMPKSSNECWQTVMNRRDRYARGVDANAPRRFLCLPTETALLPLCHSSVLLLEPISQALGAFHVLVDAFHDAAFLARGKRLALEAVDAVVEALLHEVGVHLKLRQHCVLQRCIAPRTGPSYVHEFLHLLLLHAVLQLALLGG